MEDGLGVLEGLVRGFWKTRPSRGRSGAMVSSMVAVREPMSAPDGEYRSASKQKQAITQDMEAHLFPLLCIVGWAWWSPPAGGERDRGQHDGAICLEPKHRA